MTMQAAGGLGPRVRHRWALGYLGEELEAEEGGALLFKVLIQLQFLMKKSIRCYYHNTVAGTCSKKQLE